MNQKKPKFRKQITTIEIGICPSCMEDLEKRDIIDTVSGEIILIRKHICVSKSNCNFEWIEE